MRAFGAVFTGFMLISPLAGAARAQTDHGALVSGLVSASVTENDTAPTVSGFVGYRFNRALGLGVELSSMWVEPFKEGSVSERAADNESRAAADRTLPTLTDGSRCSRPMSGSRSRRSLRA